MTEEIDHEYTKDVICPWCAHEYLGEPAEWHNVGEFDCYNCEKRFSIEIDYDVTFTTGKIEKNETN